MGLITTTKGMLEADSLDKKTGGFEDDNEITKWVEYWLEDELVHRSVHVHLKKNIVAEGIAAMF